MASDGVSRLTQEELTGVGTAVLAAEAATSVLNLALASVREALEARGFQWLATLGPSENLSPGNALHGILQRWRDPVTGHPLLLRVQLVVSTTPRRAGKVVLYAAVADNIFELDTVLGALGRARLVLSDVHDLGETMEQATQELLRVLLENISESHRAAYDSLFETMAQELCARCCP